MARRLTRLQRQGNGGYLVLFEHRVRIGTGEPRRGDSEVMNTGIEWNRLPDERRAHALPVDLKLRVGSGRRDLDHELRKARLDLGELGLRLIDRDLKSRRRARGQDRMDRRAVRLDRLDELAERRLALRDAKHVGRCVVNALCALELVERLGELPAALKLVALFEELTRRRPFRVGDLRDARRPFRIGDLRVCRTRPTKDGNRIRMQT